MDRKSREGAAWPNLCFSCTWGNGSYHGLKITGGHGCQQQWISVRQPGYKIRACRPAESMSLFKLIALSGAPRQEGSACPLSCCAQRGGLLEAENWEKNTCHVPGEGARETRRQRDRHWPSCRKEQVLRDDFLSSLELQLGVSPLLLGIGGRRWDEVHV